ncbi:MAG: hypothetical protein H0T11_02080 [Chthoniobacterales bacterium]|nr:hypothetical protein [Chthoniobacterales bacterium]
MAAPAPGSPRPVSFALLVWLAAATAVGASGLLARSPVPPPAIAVALTILLLVALFSATSLRRRVRSLGNLVAFHIVRIAAGAWFLVLSARGVLPGEFALVAGWGDIAVGIGAVLVWWRCFPLVSSTQRGTLLVWNALGLLDIVAVLANGARIFLRDPAMGEPFTRLPVALLPTFVVPLVLVSHVLIFVWGRARQQTSR